jgi:ankyrin repeat protein
MVDLNPAKEPMLEDGRTALHYASSMGDCSSVAELLATGSVDVNARDAVGYSAVQIAAAEGHLDVLRLLLRHNADVNLHDTLVSNSEILFNFIVGRSHIIICKVGFMRRQYKLQPMGLNLYRVLITHSTINKKSYA